MNGGKLFFNVYLMDLGGCLKILRYCVGWVDKIQGRIILSGKQFWEVLRLGMGEEIVIVLINFKFFFLKMLIK